MLTFCKLNIAVLYNILVKFIVSFFLNFNFNFYYYFFFLFAFCCFLFPGISSRYMTADCKFYVYTCSIQKKKVYANFECILKGIESNACSCTRKHQDKIPCSFSYKLVCADNKFSKPVFLYRGENIAYKFIEAILEEYEYCKKVIKKHFHKKLTMTEKEEENF